MAKALRVLLFIWRRIFYRGKLVTITVNSTTGVNPGDILHWRNGAGKDGKALVIYVNGTKIQAREK